MKKKKPLDIEDSTNKGQDEAFREIRADKTRTGCGVCIQNMRFAFAFSLSSGFQSGCI